MPIFGDGRRAAFLQSGFEYVALRERERVVPLLRRVRAEGLSGEESPGAAVSSGVGGVLSGMLLGLRPAREARPPPADVQLARAHAVATMMGDERYLQLIAQQDDPQRRVRGVPDSPASLMEGTAGVVCFLLDLARGRDAAGLPGWDL